MCSAEQLRGWIVRLKQTRWQFDNSSLNLTEIHFPWYTMASLQLRTTRNAFVG